MQLAPGLPSPPACPAWTERRTWLWPALSHRRCNPEDQLGADNQTNQSGLGLCLCSEKFSSDLWHRVVGLITDLAVPQVAHRAGHEQEDVVGVQRRGPRCYFGGLGVELISPPHLEEPGVSVGADPAGSVRTPLTDTHTVFILLAFSPKVKRCMRKTNYTSKMMNFPLKMDRKWRGSFPMTTLTCTGAPLYFLSRLTAW